MLEAMRKNTKVVLWITVAAFVLLIFLVWGAETQLGCGEDTRGGPQGVIGQVNGASITVQAFNEIYLSSRENFRTSRGVDPGPGDEAQMQQQTWDALVEQMLLNQEARRRGLEATDAEILNAARNNPPQMLMQQEAFLTDGRFDPQKYLSYLDSPDVNPAFLAQLEAYLRQTLPVEKLGNMIYGGARVSEPEIHEAFVDRNETARISYRIFELKDYPPGQPVTDSEAEAYFKAHPDEFNLPPQATVKAVRVDRRPTPEDVTALQQQLADYARIARRAAAGDSSASNFATLAETYSDLPSALQGGLVDRFYSAGELTPQIEAAAFSLPVGGVSEPIQDRAGIHIIQVDSVQVEGDVRKVRIRDLMVRVVPSDATIADIEEKMRALKESAAKEDFGAAAKAAGFTVTNPPAFAEGGYIRGLEAVPGPVAWAFRAVPGAVSPIFQSNDAWVLLQLVGRTTAGTPTFRDVMEVARQKAGEARQRERARRDVDAFLARVRGAASWRTAAGADSPHVFVVGPVTRSSGIPGLGREPAALGAVFSLPVGAPSPPIDVARGVMVLRVEEHRPADETQFESQRQQLAQQILGQRRNEIYQDWLKQLKAKARIKDYRDLYFRS